MKGGDELIIDVVCDRLQQEDCRQKGWLLDGFPRTKSQADALKAAGMIPDCFVMLDVPEDVVVERVAGRRVFVAAVGDRHPLLHDLSEIKNGSRRRWRQ